MRKRSIFNLLVAALISMPLVAQAAAPEVAPGPDFQAFSFGITSGGGVIVVAGLREIGGKAAVCGLVFYDKPTGTTRRIEPRFTERVIFRVGRKTLAVQTNLFSRYASEAEARAGAARCSVTQRPWDPAYAKTALKMELGSTTIRD